ncbi:MAG: hypothetical protein HC933_23065 [Pleurocapsa sp. SU_196_0]|nr:hypothetical protein [Pleurocapsa sp. SU_196_0]
MQHAILVLLITLISRASVLEHRAARSKLATAFRRYEVIVRAGSWV